MILEKVAEEDIQNGVYEIPEEITEIGNYAFAHCKNLTQIVLPKGVTKIGKCTFFNCENLTQITLPERIIEIGEGAFTNCKNLSQITLPEGVTEIRGYLFAHCESLTQITLPKGVTEIGECAFENCKSLSQLILPEGIIRIEGDAFWNCTNLEQIILDNYEIETRYIDGYVMEIKSKKELQIGGERYTAYLCTYLFETKKIYAVEKGTYAAHGTTLKQAVEDIRFKEMQSKDKREHIERVRKHGYVTPNDYRLLTGACRAGTERFLKVKNLSWEDKRTIEEVIELTKGEYGSEEFKKIMEGLK